MKIQTRPPIRKWDGIDFTTLHYNFEDIWKALNKTEATVSDATTQDIAGTNTVDKSKVEADLASLKTTVNAIIERLKSAGIIY